MPTAQDLRNRINGFDRSEYEEFAVAQMDSWLKRINEIEGIGAILDSPAIQDRIKRLEKEIKDIEVKLLTVRDMTELERHNLLDRKDLYFEFINSFDVDKSLEGIATEVEKNLC